MSGEWIVVIAFAVAPIMWAIGMLIGWVIERRRARPVLPAPTLASIMRERSMRRELELAEWDADFSVALYELATGRTIMAVDYPYDANRAGEDPAERVAHWRTVASRLRA